MRKLIAIIFLMVLALQLSSYAAVVLKHCPYCVDGFESYPDDR